MDRRIGSAVGATGRARRSWHRRARAARRASGRPSRPPRRVPALDEVDDQRHAVHAVARAQAVLEEVGVVARDARARVDLDREARRARRRSAPCRAASGGGPAWPAAGAPARPRTRKRLSSGVGMRSAHAVAERDRLGEQPLRRCGRSARSRSARCGRRRSFCADARALVVEVGLVPSLRRPTCSARARSRSRSCIASSAIAQVLAGDAVVRVADDERDVGALGRPLRAQRRVVLDRVLDLRLAAHARRCRRGSTRRPSTSSGRSIASRVVPATSETITRSEPRKRLTSDDLPTFGRPIDREADRVVLLVLLVLRRAAARRSRSSRSPVPRPCAAETAIGSPRPSA